VELKNFLRRHMRIYMNLWPPFLAAGIHVKRLDPDWKRIDVEMKLHLWNSNYVGTHYGGSLYSMADPFYMLMLMENLGRDYIVWDKSASIRFRKPGKGTVAVSFQLTDDDIAGIRAALQTEEKLDRTFLAEIRDESGTVVAEVQKVVHIRKKAA
jgi:acyl-coenzyme A thioesterase PaaI-like protein